MKTEMKVLLYLKKNEQTAGGLCPLMGKITVRGESNSTVQFACKIQVDAELWNARSQRCMGKSHVATTTNREIESLLVLLHTRFSELKDVRNFVTATDVKNVFQGIAAAQETLLKLFREHNDEYALRVGVNRAAGTYYHYKNVYRLVSQFIKFRYKVSDVTLKSLDCTFIENFDYYLRVDQRQKPNTIRGNMNCLKSVVYSAIHKGYLTVHPFSDFKVVKPEKKQLHLTSDEFSRLMNTTFDTPNRNFTRDMFLFSAFTGICYCDMRNLTEANVTKDRDGKLWIETHRQKTGTPENVMLLDIAVKIMEKYKGMAEGGKLFPMLSKESYNMHLKIMAKQCGIKRNLSYHMARHTFASLVCLSQGIPIETLSRAMGHKNITTTQRYAKVTTEKIDKDVTALHGNIEEKYSLDGIDAPPSRIFKDLTNRKVRPSWKQRQIMEEL